MPKLLFYCKSKNDKTREEIFFLNPRVPCRLHKVIFPILKASIFVLHELRVIVSKTIILFKEHRTFLLF